MCNLSQGIRDDAVKEMIISMYEEGLNMEQIAKIAKKSVDEVKAVMDLVNGEWRS